MKKILRSFFSVLLYIWQLPQILLGLCLLLAYRAKKFDTIQGIYYFKGSMGGAISLGQIVITSQYNSTREEIIKHEFGHTVQSKILGPLYLLIIGIFSGTHAWLDCKTCKTHPDGYYHYWTESWANKLADKYYKVK